MRPVSNILLAALIVAALFGGNCLSCPQMLMALASHQPGHGCCHHPAPKVDCHSQLLSHFVKAQSANAAPMTSALGAALAVVSVPLLHAPAIAAWRAADVAPPDPLTLHSLLRV
jgi:hypothetical protein